MLRNMIKEVIADTKQIRDEKPRGINHVETWRGMHSDSAKLFSFATDITISTAWKSSKSLLKIALKAHLDIKH